jgi:thiamine-phosphate pyrophosphorylase
MSSTAVFRVLDASLNRAGEGLRVVEDYVRFVLDDPLLTEQAKALRHDLATAARLISTLDRHAARDTLGDVGTDVSTASEASRGDARDVCAASIKRAEQSLRSIEEYGKLVDVEFAQQVERLRYRLYTLERVLDIGRTSREMLADVQLCVLVEGQETSAKFQALIDELVTAGVGMIQLRDKRLDDRELAARAKLLVKRCRERSSNASLSGRGTVAIINDRADIAAAVHADGVHLGQEDLTVKDARQIVGTRMLVGVSTHNIEQARAAVLDGANYLGAGPTFPSSTKSFDAFAGLDYLRQVAAEIRLPAFAIGGISPENVAEVMAAGISRIAVGAAVTAAEKPDCAAKKLLDMLRAEST